MNRIIPIERGPAVEAKVVFADAKRNRYEIELLDGRRLDAKFSLGWLIPRLVRDPADGSIGPGPEARPRQVAVGDLVSVSLRSDPSGEVPESAEIIG